jgi:mRNA-degrading endonuclease RelE of RelBE toxin-antitoxin system
MGWKVVLKESVIADIRWFGRRDGRRVLKEAETLLATDPSLETRNMKRLRPNPIPQRELRVFGKYRVLFNIDGVQGAVTIVLVGEKRGSALVVQGKEYTQHHESRPAQ